MPSATPPIRDPAVSAAFDRYPAKIRVKLMALRSLILATAKRTDGVGAIDECLKWNEPAYVTSESGSGSTIRIGTMPGSDAEYAMFFNCRTTLVESFREFFPGELRFDGTRAIVFHVEDVIPSATLAHCVEAALTYHRRRKPSRR
jgi:Domain of unknown function (DU1801)